MTIYVNLEESIGSSNSATRFTCSGSVGVRDGLVALESMSLKCHKSLNTNC